MIGERPVHLPAQSAAIGATNLQKKLEAAMILRGVVRLKLEEGEVEVVPRTWYRESGEHFIEVKRRDSGEHVKVKVSEIRDVLAY
jgi:hypothetical protein